MKERGGGKSAHITTSTKNDILTVVKTLRLNAHNQKKLAYINSKKIKNG